MFFSHCLYLHTLGLSCCSVASVIPLGIPLAFLFVCFINPFFSENKSRLKIKRVERKEHQILRV